MAQSDIELTDSTSTEWEDNIGGGITPNMPTDPVTSITLSQTSIAIEGGESIRLTAQTNSTAANKRVIWSVTDESIATVSDNGTVMGRKKGTTIVTATSVSSPEISADCEVTVMSDYIEPNLIVYTDGNGIVTGGGTYMEGTEVTLVAIPNDGYCFVKWSDGSTANPYTFILYGTTELMAFFEPIEGEGLGNGRIVSIPGGDYNVFYSDYTGKRWYLHAAGYKNWAVSETPKTIKFTAGNVTDGQAFSNAASFMESNGYYMSNVEGWDGTGSINTVPVNEGLGLEKRTWESQVFYKNNEDKYAIRLTNTVGTDWGCHLFVNIDPVTLEVVAGNPSLGDALYLWEIEEVRYYNVYYYVGKELVHTAEVAYGEAIPDYVYEPTGEGDVFNGWNGETYETMPAHDVTYVANITNDIATMSTDNGQLSTVIYDLMGRKVTDTENLKGGVYIINGHKVFMDN